MTDEPKKKVKYSIHLGTPAVKDLSGILTENASAKAQEVQVRQDLPFECKLFVRPTFTSEPSWAKKLDQFFEVNGNIKSASSAAVLVFKCGDRVMACAYGHGHTLLDNDKCENDFGLLVAANSLSDENVKLVEKANLGSVIRDATQAAGITRLQEFNVDRALSLVRKLSGNAKADGAALSGAGSITLTSDKDVDELHELGQGLLDLYNSKTYQKTAFGIIDKIKPVLEIELLDQLDQALLTDIMTASPSFELGAPEIDTQPIGYMTISGSGRRTKFPDVSLSTFLEEVPALKAVDDLHAYRLVTHSIDGTHKLKDWTLHKGLVGSLVVDSKRYALNEGKWYRIDEALQKSANSAFQAASKGLDKTFLPWPIVGRGKKGDTYVFEPEGDYNKRVCGAATDRYLHFDQQLVAIPNNPGPGIEICDILDIKERRLIHVKKSGRRSSIISHFLMQGINSAKFLRTYDSIRNDFFEAIKGQITGDQFSELVRQFPQNWTVEYKFGDFPNASGEYTIPFFSRVTLDEVKREVEALGFKAVEVSFIRLSQPAKK
jgi:uncharacterized protein (TIGR04141 family)